MAFSETRLRNGADRFADVDDLFESQVKADAGTALAGRWRTEAPVPEVLSFVEVEHEETGTQECRSAGRPEENVITEDENMRVRSNSASVEGLRKARETAAASIAAEVEARVAEERAKVERMRSEFASDRQRFFAAAESQVVRLGLAVAAKVLSREIASDGLHLRATVKAALARVQENSTTTLRVPVAEVEAWTLFFAETPSERIRVEGDERMHADECTLVTSVGRVELAVEVQLQEIERSFGEMLQSSARDDSSENALLNGSTQRASGKGH